MFRSRNKQKTMERATEYASCKDFKQIFTEDMAGLHRLAFLLTADHAKAEQCFVAGLEDSIHGNPVFRQWARAWSKRAIIQSAIKAIAPAPYATAQSRKRLKHNGRIGTLRALRLSWHPGSHLSGLYLLWRCWKAMGCASVLLFWLAPYRM